jgi:hypothetical protein
MCTAGQNKLEMYEECCSATAMRYCAPIFDTWGNHATNGETEPTQHNAFLQF